MTSSTLRGLFGSHAMAAKHSIGFPSVTYDDDERTRNRLLACEANPRAIMTNEQSNSILWVVIRRDLIRTSSRRAPAPSYRRRKISIMKILLFGSSMNPPTGMDGHLGLVLPFLDDFDEIRILPVRSHPYSFSRPPSEFSKRLAPYEDRCEMARLCFQEYPKIKISTIENDLVESLPPDAPIGTVDVLERLSRLEPENDFALLLSVETFNDLYANKWKRSKDFFFPSPLLRAGIYVVGRPGHAFVRGDDDSKSLRNVFFVDSSKKTSDLSVSSTILRKRLAESTEIDDDDVLRDPRWISRDVAAYALEHELFTKL